MPRRINIIGRTFGRLKVIADAAPHVSGKSPPRRRSLCQCRCGWIGTMLNWNLSSGHTRSCGCRIRTHGFSRTRIYTTWSKIVQRCTNPDDKSFPNYGGRGIGICKRWRLFKNFLFDMGVGKVGWTIERVDNERGYSPKNTCWATYVRQARNTRRNRIITVGTRTGCLAELCEHFGTDQGLVRVRLNRGWSPDRAFFAPKHRQGQGCYNLQAA